MSYVIFFFFIFPVSTHLSLNLKVQYVGLIRTAWNEKGTGPLLQSTMFRYATEAQNGQRIKDEGEKKKRNLGLRVGAGWQV